MLTTVRDPHQFSNRNPMPRRSCFWQLDDLADYPKVITALVAAGADINGTDMDGNAPIIWTINKFNHPHESDGYRFKYFHQQGAKLDVINYDQQTILHFASRCGQLEVVEYIRSIELAGVDPDKEDVRSHTATDDLARVSDKTITLLSERRPTRAELLSMKALLVETRERNWEQGLFLYSREDPVLWGDHLQQKSDVEELWQEYLDFCQSASRDDDDTEDEGSSIGDGDEVASRDENHNNNGEIDENAEGIAGDEKDNVCSGNDDENDDSDNDSNDSSDDYDTEDYVSWHWGDFTIAIPHWLREETMRNTKASCSSDNGSAAEEDSRRELGAVGRSRQESDDEDEVFFDANQGEE